MAKKKTFNVSGVSVKDLTKMTAKDFNRYDDATKRKITTRLVSAANKRLKRIATAGQITKEVKKYTSGGAKEVKSKSGNVMTQKGAFSVRGKSGKDINKEFQRVKKFLKSDKTTLKGARSENRKRKKIVANKRTNNLQKFVKKLNQLGYTQFTTDNIEDYISEYNKLAEINPEIKRKEYYYQNFGDVAQLYDDVGEDITEKFRKAYEEKKEAETQAKKDVSEYFKDV